MALNLLFLILAAICFVLKAFKIAEDRVDLMNLGFAFVVISMIV